MTSGERDHQSPLTSWSVAAKNLPDHARNPIHTDEGAHAAGFDAALVAGVTTYVYLAHPPVAAWGLDWVSHGSADVRFLAPVLDGDLVVCVPTAAPDGSGVEARVAEEVRATCELAADHFDPLPAAPRPGDELEPCEFTLSDGWNDYGTRAGDDLPLFADHSIVHPAVWPALANEMVHNQLARGPWVHTRSRIQHHAAGNFGATVRVSAAVIRRFTTRAGERAIVDVRIHEDDQLLAAIEHEALVVLT